MTYPELYIEHNHGHLCLRNVEVTEYEASCNGMVFTRRIARGEVVGGCEVTRLCGATSTKHYPVGEQMEYDLWGRKPYEIAPGKFRADCVSF